MKFLLFTFLFPLFCLANEIKLISISDKKSILFASVKIYDKNYTWQGMSDENGIVSPIDRVYLKDSSLYSIEVKATGFNFYSSRLSGLTIKNTKVFYLTKDTVKNIEDVIITAQYSARSTEFAIQKISVIDKNKIQQMGDVNLRDVLTNQLNVRLQQDNILGSAMSLQGMSGENVKFLIDGIPIIGRLNGSIDLTQINLHNVERIEIIEGPLSVQYGTNALAGTINIITNKSIISEQTFGITGYYESIGTYNINGDLTLSKNKHSFQLSGGRNYFDGWNPTDNLFHRAKSKIADSSRFKQWKPKEQYFVGFGYQFQFKKSDIGLKSDFFDEKIINRGYPRAPYAETSFDDYYFTQRFDNSIQFNATLSKYWKLNATAAYNSYHREKKTYYKDLTTLDQQLSPSSSDQDTSIFSLFMSRASFIRNKDSSKLNYEIGYDLNIEKASGKRIENKTQNMGDYALFVTSEFRPFSVLTIKPGLRFAYNTNYGSPLIPSLNLKWDIASNHKLRLSFSHGFRAPTIKELYFYFVDVNHNILGNVNLKDEKSLNYTLSYNLNKQMNKVNFKMDVNLFFNNISNLITLAQVNNLEYSFINVGTFKTLGLQLGNTFKIRDLALQIGLNYTGRYNELSKTANHLAFNFSPELQCNVSYRFKKIKTALSLFYKYNGKLPSFELDGEEIVQRSIDAYQMLDITASKVLLHENITLTLGCKNIFNIQNINANVSPGAHSSSNSNIALSTGRNYFIQLTLKLTQNKNTKNEKNN